MNKISYGYVQYALDLLRDSIDFKDIISISIQDPIPELSSYEFSEPIRVQIPWEVFAKKYELHTCHENPQDDYISLWSFKPILGVPMVVLSVQWKG